MQGNLLNAIILLISKLPPEAYELLEQLVQALLNAKNPVVALRIAALAIASKKGVHEIYDQLARSKLVSKRGRPGGISEADAKRLVALARDQTG